MILPIISYGDPLLRRLSTDIGKGYPNLDKLVADMFETMYKASGVGLAAPQIGLNIRLIVIDATPFADEYPELENYIRVFINPTIVSEEGEEWVYNEGCLSFPTLRADVSRKSIVELEYLDQNFKPVTERFDGIAARIVQHEYDHLQGKFFVDYLDFTQKQLIKSKLSDITKGNIDHHYKMKFAVKKKVFFKR